MAGFPERVRTGANGAEGGVMWYDKEAPLAERVARARLPRRESIVSVALAAVLALGGFLPGAQPARAADAIEVQFGAPGPHPVMMTDVADEYGNIVYQIFHPADMASSCETHPIITWGNGSFAVPSQYPGVLNQLASWGFVVIGSTHTTVGTGIEILAAAEYMVAENGRIDSPFFARLDEDNVGAVGHSQGAGGAINAANLSHGLITSVLPIALPNRVWVGPGDEFEPSELEVPVFFMSGVFDFLVSSQATNTGFYNEVSGPAAKAALTGAGHNTIQNTGGGFLGYLTAWFMYTLRDDVTASQAFLGDPPEIHTNRRWRNQAVKNLLAPDGMGQTTCADPWTSSVAYNQGDTVLHQGQTYEASRWTRNQAPGDPGGSWQQMATAADGTAFWTPSRIFDTGDLVVYEGKTYRALWWTRDQSPGTPWGPWEEIATAADGTAIWTSSRTFDTSYLVVYEGKMYRALWWTRYQTPGDPGGPWMLVE